MAIDPIKLKQLIEYGALPLVGAGVGGLTGGIFSDEGATLRGILQGAVLGSGAGVGGSLIKRFDPSQAALAATLLGGGVGGLIGQRRVSPWSVEKLKLREMENIERRRKLREKDDKSKLLREESGKLASDNTSVKESEMSGIADKVKEAREILKTEKAGAQAETPMSENEFQDRASAFEFGMDAFCQKSGIQKEALAQAAQVPSEHLTLATLAWLARQTEDAS